MWTFRKIKSSRILVLLCSVPVILGLLAIIGWSCGLQILASFRHDFFPMAFDEGVLFVFIGITVIVSVYKPLGKSAEIVLAGLMMIFSIYGLLELIQFLVSKDLTFETILFPGAGNPPVVKMSHISGFLFFICSVAVISRLIVKKRIWSANLRGLLGFIVFMAGFVFLLRYLYAAPLSHEKIVNTLPLTTSIAFFFLGSGLIVLAGEENIFLRYLMGPLSSAKLLRVILPFIILAMVFQRFLYENLESTHPFTLAPIAAFSTILLIVLVTVIITQISAIIFKSADKAEIERRRAEEILRKSEEFNKKLVESSPVGILYLDKAGRITYENRTLRGMLVPPEGTRSPVIGMMYSEIPTIREAMTDQEIQRIISGKPYSGEIIHYRSLAGIEIDLECYTTPLMDDQGQREGTILSVLDTTSRKQAEQAVTKSEKKFRSLYKSVRDGFAIVDMEGNITETNQPFLDMLGYTEEEIRTKSYLTITPLKWHEKEKMIIEQEVIPKGHSGTYEKEYIRKDGTIFPIELRTYLITDDKGNPAGMWAFINDITRRKQMENENRQFNIELENRVAQRTSQLELANKEMEAFSYSVSHDLRTPLRGISGWIQALKDESHGKLDEASQKYLNDIKNETTRMVLLIDALLELSRVTRTEISPVEVDLSEIAGGYVNIARESFPERKFDFIIAPDLKASGDPDLLKIVINNLLENACKFTQNVVPSRIEFGKTVSAGKTVFYIRDNGVGFDMKYSQDLFTAFHRLHKQSEFPGTGIGLATVQRIIHRHGGTIRAEAEPNHGATFFFTIGGLA